MLVAKGREMWEIHVFGVNDRNSSNLKQMKDKIYSSVKLK